MDSFQGSGTINLQRGTSNVPYRFGITVASSSTRNDGALPYGSSLCSFTVHAFLKGTTRGSTQPILSKSQSSNQMILRLAWTTAVNQGLYRLEFRVAASVGGSTIIPLRRQFEFARLLIKERR